MASDGKPAAGMAEAERTLEQVLRRWPDHPGANHYYIHAVESSQTPERAVPSAQRLMGVVPWAGHMVHMPAHIWLVMGDYELAATVNQRASQVDREYFAASNVEGAYNMYFVHNLHFVAYARSMQGHRAEAVKASKDMAEAIMPAVNVMPEMADSFLAVSVLTLVRVQAWDEILKMSQPGGKLFAETAIWRFARTMAMLAKGDRAGAQRERDAFEAARRMISADRPWGTLNVAGDVLTIAAESLAARFSATPAEAVPHWEKAVGIQDKLIYDEPPAWYYPVRESLGAALLRAGRAGDAETVFREGLMALAAQWLDAVRIDGESEGAREERGDGRGEARAGCGLVEGGCEADLGRDVGWRADTPGAASRPLDPLTSTLQHHARHEGPARASARTRASAPPGRPVLLVAEGRDGVDAGGAFGGNVAREQGDRGEDDSGRGQMLRGSLGTMP